MLNIAVLISGSGTNLQALIDAEKQGKIKGRIVAVVSNNEDAYGLERARLNNIECAVIKKKGNADFDGQLTEYLKSRNVDLVVLAGFLSILGNKMLKEFENRIINIHPSLIPSFCGDGFYGLKVHQKAMEYGVKVTGATVHFVNDVVDGGKIIMQKALDVLDTDTPETLRERVMEVEWEILVKSVAKLCDERNT